MQFDQYFAPLQQKPDGSPNITILKPDGQAVSGYYDFAQKRLTLSDSEVTAKTKNQALAEVLLPSWLYREQR
ncbi:MULTISPECIES: hypothetical protein [unclassified Alishewanella]|uniref:hypothetical protein n=1 Tax=unclassified Alishewanella TaxID=2628974 RepID=UPI004043473C